MRRLLRTLPWVMVTSSVILLVSFLVLGFSRDRVPGVDDFSSRDVTFMMAFALFAPIGALIASRHPRNPIGWISCGIGLFQLSSGTSFEYALRSLIVDPGSLPGGDVAVWVSSWTWAPGLGLVALMMLLFPTGHPPTRRWLWVGWMATASSAALVVYGMFMWGEQGRDVLLDETIEVPPAVELAASLMFASALVAFVSLVVRFRRSSGIERLQLKWLAYVASIAGILIIPEAFLLEPLGLDDSTLGVTLEIMLNLSAACFPIAAAVAILRYRLYDIDLIINRTLVYGSLTTLLAVAYIGIVVTLQNVIPGADDSDLTIAGSTLAVAALFRPLRARVQSFIDRRFYRRKVDAQETLESFSSRLREDVDLDHLSRDLLGVVRDTMQPAHASLWLRTEVSR